MTRAVNVDLCFFFLSLVCLLKQRSWNNFSNNCLLSNYTQMKYNRRYSSIFRVKNKKFVEYQPKWKKREEEEMEMAMQLEKDKAVLRGTKGEGA